MTNPHADLLAYMETGNLSASDFSLRMDGSCMVMSGEASTIFSGRAPHVRFSVRGRLGVQEFAYSRTVRDAEGDVTHWVYEPVRPDLVGRVAVHILND